jgi:putative endonuclease
MQTGGMSDLVRRFIERARHLLRPSPLSTAAEAGRRGERLAARYLKAAGYLILERNYRITQGEIDLIAFRDGVLAFVEVRSQATPGPLDPLHSITRGKQRRIIKAAEHYVATHRPHEDGVATRFDVVTVRCDQAGGEPEIRHVRGAFHRSPRGFT